MSKDGQHLSSSSVCTKTKPKYERLDAELHYGVADEVMRCARTGEHAEDTWWTGDEWLQVKGNTWSFSDNIRLVNENLTPGLLL